MSDMASEVGGLWARRVGLTVVAILVIAGAYKFHKFSSRNQIAAKLMGVNGQLVMIGDTLDGYHEKAGAYFPPAPEGEPRILDISLINPQFLMAADVDPREFYPDDLFAPEEYAPVHYWTDNTNWLIWSAGPDGDYDLDPYAGRWASYDDIAKALETEYYDMSRGLYSSGDLYKVYHPVAPDAGQAE